MMWKTPPGVNCCQYLYSPRGKNNGKTQEKAVLKYYRLYSHRPVAFSKQRKV